MNKTEQAMRKKADAKYGLYPVGTKIGVIGHEKSDDVFWEKTADNQWTRNGIGSNNPTITNAEMEGNRLINQQSNTQLTKTKDHGHVSESVNSTELQIPTQNGVESPKGRYSNEYQQDLFGEELPGTGRTDAAAQSPKQARGLQSATN